MKSWAFLLLFALLPVAHASSNELDRCSTTGENTVWQIVRGNPLHITETKILKGNSALPDDALTNAVIFGYKDLIYKLLKNHTLVLQHGGNALSAAASMGRIDITRILIGNGISANALNENGTTALFEAVVYGCTDELAFLVTHGANINYRPNNQHATLMVAAFAERHYQTAAALLQNGYKATQGEIRKIKTIITKRDGGDDVNGALVYEYLFPTHKTKDKSSD
ncbi:MAG TPA: ankyrin repeat domain-containing protein [Gammaproteobacteria bacterium]|nr:ankyrin repeat domain-containing protein [Gammaproteobacteria bacterium]